MIIRRPRAHIHALSRATARRPSSKRTIAPPCLLSHIRIYTLTPPQLTMSVTSSANSSTALMPPKTLTCQPISRACGWILKSSKPWSPVLGGALEEGVALLIRLALARPVGGHIVDYLLVLRSPSALVTQRWVILWHGLSYFGGGFSNQSRADRTWAAGKRVWAARGETQSRADRTWAAREIASAAGRIAGGLGHAVKAGARRRRREQHPFASEGGENGGPNCVIVAGKSEIKMAQSPHLAVFDAGERRK